MIRARRLPALLAVFFSLSGVFAALWVGEHNFDRIPHLEDEIAYYWQAQALERGVLRVPSPACPECFLVPFVVDHAGWRTGKYPLAWPAALSLGTRFGVSHWVNPLLAGACLWLIYRLGEKVFSPWVGVLANGLTLTSPFFLLNSGSLLAHVWSLFLAAAFLLAWLDAFPPSQRTVGRPRVRPWVAAVTAAVCLGALALTRPLTAAGVALPCILHGAWLLLRGSAAQRRRALLTALGAALLAGVHFLWQFAVTGDPLTSPYTLWWPYDRIGFGPGVGLRPGGHSPAAALLILRSNLSVGAFDLFGWAGLSSLFLPLGAWAARRSRAAWIVAGSMIGLIAAYLLYWVGAELFGPRYYFEGLPGAVLLTAAGIAWLWQAAARRSRSLWALRGGLAVLVVGLVGYNLGVYLPQRLAGMTDLYGISGERLAQFQAAARQAKQPALVVVHHLTDWTEYGNLLPLQNPFLDTPQIFVYAPSPEALSRLRLAYPDRAVLHYYATFPDQLFEHPLPSRMID